MPLIRLFLLFFIPLTSLTFFVITPFKLIYLIAFLILVLLLSRDVRGTFYAFRHLRYCSFFLFIAAAAFPDFLPYTVAVYVAFGLVSIAQRHNLRESRKIALQLMTLVLWLLSNVLGHFMLPVFWGLTINTLNACNHVDMSHQTAFGSKGIDKFGTAYDVVSDNGRLFVNCRNAVASVSGDSISRFPGDFQRVYFDPESKTYAAASYWSHYFSIYDMNDGKQLLRRDAGNKFFMDIDMFGGKYYLISENDASIYVYDLKRNSFKRYFIHYGSPYSLRINHKTGIMYISTWGNGDILAYDTHTMKRVRSAQLFPSLMGITLNESKNTVLVAQPLKSRIAELDGNTLRVIRHIPAGFGVRDIQFDPKDNVVHAANYFSGTYTKTDYATGRVLTSVSIGQSARGVYHDDTTEKTYAVSNCGAFQF